MTAVVTNTTLDVAAYVAMHPGVTGGALGTLFGASVVVTLAELQARGSIERRYRKGLACWYPVLDVDAIGAAPAEPVLTTIDHCPRCRGRRLRHLPAGEAYCWTCFESVSLVVPLQKPTGNHGPRTEGYRL